jgi:hypothetical protein
MTPKRVVLAGAVLAALAGVAVLSKESPSAGEQMVASAAELVGSLNDDQKNLALFAFDDRERTNWNFVPLQDKKKPLRKGLRMDRMTGPQQNSTLDLLKAGTSASGFLKATTIMSLEVLLRELEKNGANVRHPGWYFLSVFGTPAQTGRWGWRIEGHHLSLNFVIDHGKVVAATPAFFGANPAHVNPADPRSQRTLPEAEDLALELFASLDDGQRKAALQAKQFDEIEQGKPAPTVGAPVGLAATKMTDRQRNGLRRLIQSYADRMPPEVAAVEMDEVKRAGLDAVHFAFARQKDKPGQPYTYRVQGPTFVVEFLNVQADSAGNPANHIHSSWRNLHGDFGLAQR